MYVFLREPPAFNDIFPLQFSNLRRTKSRVVNLLMPDPLPSGASVCKPIIMLYDGPHLQWTFCPIQRQVQTLLGSKARSKV
jgi:hypothetical protein